MKNKEFYAAYENPLKRKSGNASIMGMIQWLIRRYTKGQDPTSAHTRDIVGRISGSLGIFFNIFLFVIKFGIGTIVHSISIQADGINNLTDAGSSIVSVISFHFANKPADQEHPFGHQRTETLTSFVIALFLCVLGIRMMEESILKIQHPNAIDFRWITILVLVISICVKGYMYFYNMDLSKTYHSSLLKAVAMDAISDLFGTSAVLLSTCISPLLHVNLDGYMGVIVSVLILYNAFQLIKETVNDLIGKAPDPETIKALKTILMEDDKIFGVHDVMIHDYGPGQVFASAHVEVDAEDNILDIHDTIDNLEHIVKDQLQMELVLHMDPVKINDPLTNQYRLVVKNAIKEIDEGWTFHDFRIVDGPTHTNLVFDLVVPFNEKRSKAELTQILEAHIKTHKKVYLVITIDHPMTGA